VTDDTHDELLLAVADAVKALAEAIPTNLMKREMLKPMYSAFNRMEVAASKALRERANPPEAR